MKKSDFSNVLAEKKSNLILFCSSVLNVDKFFHLFFLVIKKRQSGLVGFALTCSFRFRLTSRNRWKDLQKTNTFID